MRILHIISSIGMFGAENVLLNLAKLSQEKTGYIPYLICLKSADKAEPRIHHRAEKLGISSKAFSCNGKLDFKIIARIRKFIIREGIQIVHSHNYKSNLYGLLAAKSSGRPIVATLHGWTGEDKKVKFYELLDKWLMRRMDYLVPVSPAILDELKKRRVNKDKVRFISNGVDVDRFSPSYKGRNLREEFGLESNIVVGTAGRLNPEKGHQHLLEAFKQVCSHSSNIKLLIVGNGRLEDSLKARAQDLGLKDKVIFAGEQSDMPSVYKAVNIFVLPSIKEGLPLVLLEAMSMGLAVVAAKVGGVPYVVDKEGILVSPGDSKELAGAIISLIKRPALRDELGKRARKRVVSQFSLDSFYKQYQEMYENMLKK